MKKEILRILGQQPYCNSTEKGNFAYRSKHQDKSLRRRFILVSMLTLCTAMVSIFAFQSSTLKAYASSLSDDPLVVVSVDKTQSSSCTEVFQANVGTPQVSTTHILCPPGTIMADVKKHRSQAIAQHEAYAIVPSTQASSVVYQKYLKQIQILNASKQASLRSLSLTSQYVHPATRCGQNGSASLTWSTEGGKLNASISFFKSADCSTASFGDSQLNTITNLQYPMAWQEDSYAGNEWNVPNCPEVDVVGHYFHLVNQSAHVGYYYENKIEGSIGGSVNCFTPLEWDNIGPIN